MTEDLEQLLKNLKLRRIVEIYDEQARVAEKDDLSYSDFVTRLLRAHQARYELRVAEVVLLGRARLFVIDLQDAPQLEILQ